MWMLIRLLITLLHSLLALFRSREEQAMVEMALRQQLSIYTQQQRRPRVCSQYSPTTCASVKRTPAKVRISFAPPTYRFTAFAEAHLGRN